MLEKKNYHFFFSKYFNSWFSKAFFFCAVLGIGLVYRFFNWLLYYLRFFSIKIIRLAGKIWRNDVLWPS